MRVLLTTDTVGGVWVYAQELTEGLLACTDDDAPHSVALASIGRTPNTDQKAWAESLSTRFPARFAFAAIDAPLEWQHDNATAYSAAEAVLLALAAQFRPDLLHTSQFCFGALPLAMPRIVIAHSDVLSWADATRQAGLEPSGWLTQYIALVQGGLACATCVVAPTHAMLADLARHFTLPDRAAVIPNGRSLSLQSSHPERKLQAVTAGRLWDEAKNVTVFDTIKRPLPIVVAGESRGDTSLASPNLHLVGHLPQPELLALFQQSAIYLCTSLYEPFGLAPLEAALCGCAVVANDIPSLREVWGDAALFFNDSLSLESVLHLLTADPAALLAAQARARDRAALFTSQASTSATLALFRELLITQSREPHAAA